MSSYDVFDGALETIAALIRCRAVDPSLHEWMRSVLEQLARRHATFPDPAAASRHPVWKAWTASLRHELLEVTRYLAALETDKEDDDAATRH